MKNPTSWNQRFFQAQTWKIFLTLSFDVCVLLFFSISAHGTFPDFRELKWGLGLSDFHQMDADIEIEKEWPIEDGLTAIRLDQNSQNFPGPGSLILIFDQELGLVKTQWESSLIKRDEPGTKGLEAFERVKATLTQQYGPPGITHEELSVKLQGFHGSFYQCLQEKTCGQWQSIWETPEGGILILELVGLNPGIGIIQMTHQGPNFSNALQHTDKGLHTQGHDT